MILVSQKSKQNGTSILTRVVWLHHSMYGNQLCAEGAHVQSKRTKRDQT
jgi:hypothetical protein